MAIDATSGVDGPDATSTGGERDRPDAGAIRETAGRVPDAAVGEAARGLAPGQGDSFQRSEGTQVAQAGALVMPRVGPMSIPRTGPMEIPARPSITAPGTPSATDNVLENRGDRLRGKWEDRAVHKGKQDGGAVPGGADNQNPDEDYRENRDDGEHRARKERDKFDRDKERSFQRKMKDGIRGIFDWFTRPPPADMGPIA